MSHNERFVISSELRDWLVRSPARSTEAFSEAQEKEAEVVEQEQEENES